MKKGIILGILALVVVAGFAGIAAADTNTYNSTDTSVTTPVTLIIGDAWKWSVTDSETLTLGNGYTGSITVELLPYVDGMSLPEGTFDSDHKPVSGIGVFAWGSSNVTSATTGADVPISYNAKSDGGLYVAGTQLNDGSDTEKIGATKPSLAGTNADKAYAADILSVDHPTLVLEVKPANMDGTTVKDAADHTVDDGVYETVLNLMTAKIPAAVVNP